MTIRKTRTSPRHPQGNGHTERFKFTLIKMIRAYLEGEQENWDENLGCLEAAYRSTQHETTGLAPNMLMLGREVRQPYEIIITPSSNQPATYVEYVTDLHSKMQKAHNVARHHFAQSSTRQKDTYDAKSSVHLYVPGDLVWVLHEQRSEGICPKLEMMYLGPQLVLTKLSDQIYVVQVDRRGKTRTIHHDKLKKYDSIIELPWAKAALRHYRTKHPKSMTIRAVRHSYFSITGYVTVFVYMYI